MSEVRATLEYRRNTATDRITKLTLDFQLLDGLPGGVTYNSLGLDLASGVAYLLSSFQKVTSVSFSNLVYNILKKTWVTSGVFHKQDTDIAGMIAVGGDKTPIGEGTLFHQLDSSGRKTGRMIIKGNITEGMLGDTNENSYSVPASISDGLENALDFGLGMFLPGGLHYAYAKFANYHGGKKGPKVAYVSNIIGVRTKQYRGVQARAS